MFRQQKLAVSKPFAYSKKREGSVQNYCSQRSPASPEASSTCPRTSQLSNGSTKVTAKYVEKRQLLEFCLWISIQGRMYVVGQCVVLRRSGTSGGAGSCDNLTASTFCSSSMFKPEFGTQEGLQNRVLGVNFECRALVCEQPMKRTKLRAWRRCQKRIHPGSAQRKRHATITHLPFGSLLDETPNSLNCNFNRFSLYFL